jgi:hypothetical protein
MNAPAPFMKLFTIDSASIPLGRALAFSLRSEDGVLLARKGHLFHQRSALNTLAAHGDLCVDMREAAAYRQAVAMPPPDASAQQTPPDFPHATADFLPRETARRAGLLDKESVHVDWPGLQCRANALLRCPRRDTFLLRIGHLQQELARLVRRSPDATLLALTHMAAEENQLYSATHALFVCAIASLAAQEVLLWPHELVTSLGLAALTMNISMTELHDRLTAQVLPLSALQQSAVKSHAPQSVALLRQMGVTDPVWLGAVAAHHRSSAGALESRSDIDKIARLLHRADIFSARLSPRASRPSLTSFSAMKAAYLDEDSRVDDAGEALIKVLGIYHPGALVKLESEELAVVVRRGVHGLHPWVAVLVNKNGMTLAEPVLRDTSMHKHRIVSMVSRTDVRARTDLLRLLAVA